MKLINPLVEQVPLVIVILGGEAGGETGPREKFAVPLQFELNMLLIV